MIRTLKLSVLIGFGCAAMLALAQVQRRAPAEKSPKPTVQQEAAANSNMELAKNALGSEAQLQITQRRLTAAVDPEVMQGYRALQTNKFAQAREAYSQVLARSPTQRDALLGIAYAHHALGDVAQAIATLRRLIELYPRDSDATSALYLIGGGDPQIEESKIKQLLERSERPALLHYALGVLYFEQNRFGESERSFDRALALNPEQADYAYNLALSLDRLGRRREAAKNYVLALNLIHQSNAAFNPSIARARLRLLTSEP